MRNKRYLLIGLIILFGALLLFMFSLRSGFSPVALTSQASPTPGSPPPEDSLVVKLGDNGRTIQMVEGQRFLLDLGNDYQWDIKIDNPNVLQRVVNIMVIKGAQGVYQAEQAGSTTLSATGTPVCQPGAMCPQLALEFKLQVVVSAQ